MAFPYQHTAEDGTHKLVLNYTFWLGDHTSQFGWGYAATPRSHGDRAQDRAYLNGKQLVLRGFVGAGFNAAAGSLPFGWTLTQQVNSVLVLGCSATTTDLSVADITGFAPSGRIIVGDEIIYYSGKTLSITPPIGELHNCLRGMEGTTAVPHTSTPPPPTPVVAPSTESQYFTALEEVLAHFHTYQRGILDLRNGWVQYVLTEAIKDTQVEGVPDTRAIDITFHAEDPLAYSLRPINGIIGGTSRNQLLLMVNGDAPSRHYRLRLRATVPPTERIITVMNGVESMDLTVPRSGGSSLYVNGYQRIVHEGNIGLPKWSRYGAGSTMLNLRPGLNTWTFRAGLSSPAPLVPFGNTTINAAGFADNTTASLSVWDTTLAFGGVPLYPAAGYITIGNEVIQYSSKDATHFLGLTRARLGTTAAAHGIGADVFPVGANSSTPNIQAELVAHGATYLADSFRVPQHLPPGIYDIAEYDLDVYG